MNSYLTQKKRELLSGRATQGTRSGRGGHSARACRHGVNDGRNRSSGPGRDRSRGPGPGRGRSRGPGRDRGYGRGRSSGQEGQSPAPSTVTKALQEHSRTSEAPESNKVPDGECMHNSSGDISSIDMPISLPLLSQEDCPDTAPSPPICQLPRKIHPGLPSNSLGNVDSTTPTHAGQGTQVLANGYLSSNHGREDSGLQSNDSDHFVARSSELMVASALPQSRRSLRPLPRKVATKYIPPRHGQQSSYSQPSRQALNQEGVDRLLTDIGRNASLMHSQTVSVHMEDWARDDDQDDVADVDDIANEFDIPSVNDTLPPLSSCREVANISVPTIEQRKPRLPVMPPIWAEVCTTLCEHTVFLTSM